jgi:hypothetical protein
MKNRFFICLTTLAVLIVFFYLTSARAEQPGVSQAIAASQTPSSSSSKDQYMQSPADRDTTPPAARGSTNPYETARPAFAWSTLFVGLLTGGVFGFLVGCRSPRT